VFNPLTANILRNEELPDDSRRRMTRQRLGAVFALASALAVGVATTAAPQTAEAVTNLDGQWTVVHGGTGQLSLNADGTYTSTCQVTPGYADAFCPAPTGTFERNTLGSSFVNFHGADSSITSYRFSGDVYNPDTITSTFASTTYSPLVMKKGSEFVCTNWGDNGYRMKGSPLVYLDSTGTILYATGSHDLLGPATADTQVYLAETASNYFQSGGCADFAPTPVPTPVTHHIGDLDNATTAPSSLRKWQPTVVATVLDSTGKAVAAATVSGTFSHHTGTLTCTTAADGTCTLGNFSLNGSTSTTVFTVTGVEKPSSTYAPKANSDPDGDSNGTSITVMRP
jgi:hypothetical protein